MRSKNTGTTPATHLLVVPKIFLIINFRAKIKRSDAPQTLEPAMASREQPAPRESRADILIIKCRGHHEEPEADATGSQRKVIIISVTRSLVLDIIITANAA